MGPLRQHTVKKNRQRKLRQQRQFYVESLESRQLLAADILGAVYNDVNGDGVHNNGEHGLANWTVFLDSNSNGNLEAGEPSAVTDADGKYAFRGVAAGDYRVAEVVRTGWTATNPTTGYTDVTVTDGQEKTVNFLNHGSGGTGVITGNVWRDINNNGVQDPEDTGLAGWTLYLDLNGDGVLDPSDPFVLTDGNGDYTFTGILGGAGVSAIDYEVTEVVPAGWEPKDINITAAVIDGQTTSGIDFSNWPDPEKLAGISGTVWNDLNGNGVQDGEDGLQGWRVYADLNINNTLDPGEPNTTTGALGDYTLTGLNPGNIRIAEELPIDFKATSPSTGYQTVVVPATGILGNVNFGNQQRSDAAIGGVIFVDRNKDGVRDPGEEGLPGITVYLDVDNSGSLTPGDPSMVTSVDHFYTPDVDEAGSYRFEKLAAGTYVVRQIVPAELDSPGSDIEHTVTVGPSDDINDLELGDEYRPSEIHGFKYEDINGNHVRDTGEPGIEGVTIFIDLNRNNMLDTDEPTTLTRADGSYEFVDLAAGAYVVREVVPGGFIQTFPQTRDGILWPAGVSNPAVGNVTPTLIELSLAEGDSHTQTVSLTLPTTGALTNMVDVFLLFDDTGSFTFNSPIVRAAFPEIIAQLQTRLPGINLGFGVGRLEEYGNFADEYSTGRPFILNQPVIASSSGGYTDAEILASIQAALDHEAPGYGGDTPETVIEALYQMVTGAGFDGNNNGSLLDSGAAGLLSTQVDPGSSGDVPPFASFTPDSANGVLAPSGTIGGAGFRSGALPIIITATDTGFAYQPKGETDITGIDGLTVPATDITYNGRDTTPFNSGAGIQETVTGLNALGALVIGLGTNPEATIDPRIGLEALAKLTGSINHTANTIENGTADPIAPNDPLYFMIGDGGDPLVKNIADGIVAAIEGAVTAVQVNVTLRASDPRVHINFTPGVINGLGAGDTATFEVTFTGDGRPHRFDLQFIREGTDVVLGSIPIVLGTPIAGDGYEFEDCEDGEHSQEIDFGNQRLDGFVPNVAPSFTAGANQIVAEDAGVQTVTAWATNISPGPATESTQLVDFIVSNGNNALFADQPTVASNGTLSFTPADNAFGTAIVSVAIHDNGGTTGGGVDTSAPQTFTITVDAVNDAPVGAPTITGTAQKGQLLTADTSGISDADGLGSFGHQWLRDGVAIDGATVNTYLPGDADVGTRISVQVSYTDGHGTSEGPLTSAPTAPVTQSVGSILVTPTSLVTTEGGEATTFEISLGTVPTATVTIPISSSDTSEGTISVTEVVFTKGDQGPITVTVTPVDDLLAGSLDGNIVYSIITGAAISSDSSYSGLNADDVAVTNQDNDVAIEERVYADSGFADGLITGSESGGGIVATHGAYADDAAEQVLMESSVAVTGGKRPKLGSVLEYRWFFPSLTGATTFHVDAFQSNGADDNFRFEYSTDNGSNWNVLGTINQSTPYQNLTVNNLSVTGNALVRVVDTDHSPASGKSPPILDSVTIDQIYLEKLQEDLRPAVTITALDGTASENPTEPGIFRFERSEASSNPLQVSYAVSGTAGNGSDFDLLGETITIPAGATFIDLVVNPLDDSDPEGPETVVLTLLEQPLYRLGSSSYATVTIADDDLQQFVATSDVAGSGTVSGDFTLTHNAGDSESIRERESGGKPANRYSYLQHSWTFDVTGAKSFYLSTSTTATVDGFVFAYSTDNGATYPAAQTLTTLGPGGSISQTYAVPNLSGTIYVRVVDTNQVPGETTLETVSIEQMYFSTQVPLFSTTAGPNSDAPVLTQSQLSPFLDEAVSRWQATGIDTSILTGVKVQIADLSDTTLGLAAGNTIWLDDNAAGWGWFIDSTPGDDVEFIRRGSQGEQDHMDLLTVVMHELGHLLGHDHDGDGVMAETLAQGVRRTGLEHDDAEFVDHVFEKAGEHGADAWLGVWLSEQFDSTHVRDRRHK